MAKIANDEQDGDDRRPTQEELTELRKTFVAPFKISFMLGFSFIAVYAIVGIISVFVIISRLGESAAASLLALRVIQVTLGMMIGFFLTLVGVVVSWMGIETKYRVTGKTGGGSLVLASASPGILLIVCGSLLVALCLARPFEVSESRPKLDAPSADKNDAALKSYQPTGKDDWTGFEGKK